MNSLTFVDDVTEAIQKCPFLKALVQTQGEQYARRLATNTIEKALSSDKQNDHHQIHHSNKVFKAIHDKTTGIIPIIKDNILIQKNELIPEIKNHQNIITIKTASISLSGFFVI